jgi:hypothetical protein
MTSLIKNKAENKGNPDVVYVGGPYYVDAQSTKVLFPFSFKNGELEIVTANGFNITSGEKPLNFGTTQGGLARRHGGLNLVQTIGPNFKTYIYNCTWGPDSSWEVNSLSSIKVYTPGVITRVQQLEYTDNLPLYINPSGDAYVVSSKAPEGFALDTTYGTTYAFEKPLVIQVQTAGNGIQYITFFTAWDH